MSRYKPTKAKQASARIVRHGSPERVGFRRSDDRHPKHPAHLSRFHANGICNCVGRVQRRDVPARLEQLT